MKITLTKSDVFTLCIVALVSCKNPGHPTPKPDTTATTFLLTDSSKAALIKELDTIVASNSASDDITVDARFVDQGKDKNGNAYITLLLKGQKSITLNNPMPPFKPEEIAKLKKKGDNITVTYSNSDKKVKFLAADFEPDK